MRLRIDRGRVPADLESLVAQAPSEATLVIMHSATLAYLSETDRRATVDTITSAGAHWLSFEGRQVSPGVPDPGIPVTPDVLFVAALDGRPYAVANGHGDHLTLLGESTEIT